jgi:hypothetical protein
MSITELLAPIYNDKDLQRLGLEEKAVKILNRFIERSEEYLSLSAAKQNYKSITSHEVFAIISTLERIGYVIGKLDRGRSVYKFNNTSQRTAVSVPLSHIELQQKRFEERLAKKIERAAKTIERYKNLGSIVEIVSSKEDKVEKDREVERQMVKGVMPQKDYTPTMISVKTALEKHQSNECDSTTCRFCLLAQGLEL